MVSFTMRTLYPRGNISRFILDRRLGMNHSPSGSGDEKEVLASAEN
jgi:hypothetical protein